MVFDLKKEMTELEAINIEDYPALRQKIKELCRNADTAWESFNDIVQLKALKSAQTMLNEGRNFEEIKINGIAISVSKDGVVIKDDQIPF